MKSVRIICHWESDGWWAESPDMDRWSAAADSYSEVIRLAEEVVAFVFREAAGDPSP